MEDDDFMVQLASETADLEVQQELFSQGEFPVLRGLARNRSASGELLQRMFNVYCMNAFEDFRRNGMPSDFDALGLCYLLAANPRTPTGVLDRLASCTVMNELMAGNPSCPAWLLEKLADDDSWDIVEAVASNPGVTDVILDRIQCRFEGRFDRKSYGVKR